MRLFAKRSLDGDIGNEEEEMDTGEDDCCKIVKRNCMFVQFGHWCN